jgi:D-serine dehydratase
MRDNADDTILDASFKGIPYGARVPLADVGAQGWNVVAGDMPLPLLTLHIGALENNVAAMAKYCADHGVLLAPHGKTTLSPQLFRRQLDAGAWAITAATPGQVQLMRGFGVDRILLANELVDANAVRWIAEEYRRDPKFELLFLVDNPANVRFLDDAFGAAAPGRPVSTLVELGYQGAGGRTGVRTQEEALAVARQVAGSRNLMLAGVETYEGVVTSDASPDDLAAVDRFLAEADSLVRALHAEGLLEGRFVLSAGGSLFFDRVVAAFIPLRESIPGLEVVLRSGCYISQDAGRYHRLSPLDGRRAEGVESGLRNALTLWGAVVSAPEASRVVVGAGKRDASYDTGMPVPERLYRRGTTEAEDLDGAGVVKLMDQHAIVDVDPSLRIAPGDIMTFGVSHPCAAFDRWRFIPLIDDETNVVDGITTYF